MALGIWMPFWKKKFNYFLNIIYMVEVELQNGEQQENVLDSILEAKTRGDLSVPSWSKIQEAKFLAEHIDDPEEKASVQKYLYDLESFLRNRITSLIKKMNLMKNDPSKILSQSEMNFLRENIDGVPAEDLDGVNSMLENSEELLAKKETQRKNEKVRLEGLINRLDIEISAMQNSGTTLLDVGTPLTQEEREIILKMGGLSLTELQRHFLVTGKVLSNSADASVDAAGARIALNMKEAPTMIVPKLAGEKVAPVKKSFWDRLLGK